MTSASVVITSKYKIALKPTRPTRLKLPIPAMPTTTVVKIIGATIMRIRRMKPSPSGLKIAPLKSHCCPKK
jgi:hypothetical protein